LHATEVLVFRRAPFVGLLEFARMQVEVEIDVFSGRANPRYAIEAEEVLQPLDRMPETDESVPEPPALGLRGVLVHLPDELGGTLRVFNGHAVSQTRTWRDIDRQLEKQLLLNGKGIVEPELLDSLISEMMKN
jgi:hypothetical protein